MRIVSLLFFVFCSIGAYAQKLGQRYINGAPVLESHPGTIFVGRDSILIYYRDKFLTASEFEKLDDKSIGSGKIIVNPDSIKDFISKHVQAIIYIKKEEAEGKK